MTDLVEGDNVARHEPGDAVLLDWEDGILRITMNRPAVANALNPTLLLKLDQAFRIAAEDRCKAVVLCGAGRNFCAGADLRAYQDDAAAMQLETAFHPPVLALAGLRKPVVAAINGAAAGGGLGLALAADIRVMGRSSRLHPAWVHLGLAPDLGASWILPRLMGYSRAFEWLALGEPMDADRAQAFGLANAVVEDGDLVDSAMGYARRLAAQPSPALRYTKQLMLESYGRDYPAQVAEEAVAQRLASSDGAREGNENNRIAGITHN